MNAILKTVGLAALGGAITLGVYKIFLDSPKEVVIHEMKSIPVASTSNTTPNGGVPSSFNVAAESSLNSVVHVKVSSERKTNYVDPFEYFFGNGQPKTQSQIVWGTGSGVIISDEGYIVTNNHVIEGANEVIVTLNDNREYQAEVIGADPTTDIALLSIKADDLAAIQVTNSDDVRVGDWVLAVGNPFNLTSTVTAGIVSAKGRSIGILDRQSAIESFIQTDAAVNPGNSGGALVNTAGQLVGINTAISTHTGSFEGYSFAVPSNIVKKVVEDIMEFGSVQRGFIGVNIVEVSQPLVDEMDLEVNSGVLISELVEGGAADDAGLRKGDVITSVDGKTISRNSQLLEQIGKKRPGDKSSITVNRFGETKQFSVTLKNREGTTALYKTTEMSDATLGAYFAELTTEEKKKLGDRNGIKVVNVDKGKLGKAGVPSGFVIVKVNNQYINSTEDFEDIIDKLSAGDGVLIQGFNADGSSDYFAFGK